jgi:dTDP-4-dehydrorhamnose 3,5-epimerase|tara:strand:- start:8749 stop:9189 length:441 start_codon:yes stop_codon:yes gene_type:complete
MINGIIITPLSIIDSVGGAVLHGMKSSDPGYSGFGEAYFSTVDPDAIKGWKRHRKMVLNLVVAVGSVRFILLDDRQKSTTANQFQEVVLSRERHYARLTVPPLVWVGFQGTDKEPSMLLNIANIKHSPDEVERKALNEIEYNWSKL